MMPVSVENKTEKVPDKIVCESCGKEFSCGANVEKCWCFAVEMDAGILTELSENFNRCLCQNCLEKLATNDKK